MTVETDTKPTARALARPKIKKRKKSCQEGEESKNRAYCPLRCGWARGACRFSALQCNSNGYFIPQELYFFVYHKGTLSANYSLIITGDYRQLSFPSSNVSLLGYNLTILYNSSLSYLHPGPSFFPLPLDSNTNYLTQQAYTRDDGG